MGRWEVKKGRRGEGEGDRDVCWERMRHRGERMVC